MVTHKVLFLPYNIEIDVLHKSNIISIANDAGLHINASCGGGGVCGKCRILIENGEIEGGVSEKLDSSDISKGFRLACISHVIQDIVVSIPVESQRETNSFIDFSLPNSNKLPINIKEINDNFLEDKKKNIPIIDKLFLKLHKPNNSDRDSDINRILNYLKNKLGEHNLEVSFSFIRKLPDIIRQANFSVTVTLLRSIKRRNNKSLLVNVQVNNQVNKNFAIAIDIGTTTIYGELINLVSGKTLLRQGLINDQISYGEDIISRIIYAENKSGLSKLNEVVIENINKLIFNLIKISSINRDYVSILTFAANTTMTQIFLNINPHYIRVSPYIPVSVFYPSISVKNLKIKINDHAFALVYPTISSYVGGDIVAGVVASGMYKSDKITLFIDLGTNAEIVLGNKDWMMCAACSAGPAFEGGGIEFGIRATMGAIEDFSIDPISLEPKLITVGGALPKGICGSGLITIVASMFEVGLINNAGKFDFNLKTSRIRYKNRRYEYVLAWKEQTQINRDITINEIDIENLIRAKGAIFSGFMSLIREVGMKIGDLDRIILAGGFGSYVNLEKAMVIGLLPEIDYKKVVFLGNSSLIGAKMSCINNCIREDVIGIVDKMTNCELSEIPSYMDNYIASLFLPHTDIDMFPKLKKKLMQVENKDKMI